MFLSRNCKLRLALGISCSMIWDYSNLPGHSLTTTPNGWNRRQYIVDLIAQNIHSKKSKRS